MVIYKIRKRNGSIVSFEIEKIEKAIKRAIEAVGGTDFSQVHEMAKAVGNEVERKIGKNIPDVETIQDAVEQILIKSWYDQVAKAFIIYRQKRSESRITKNVVIEVANTMDEYLQNLDWRINENANIGYSIGWLILKNSEKITANYRLSHIYPEEVGNAHRNGDYHIHDLWMFAPYCAGRSLRQLLEEWFNGVAGKLESAPPRHLQSAVNQMVNFLGTLQNERAGAQAFSSFDTYLSPFVHKYEIELEKELDDIGAKFKSEQEKADHVYKKTYRYVKQQLQNFVFNMNVPSRRGTQTPFSNITLDRTCPEDLKNKALMLGGIEHGYYDMRWKSSIEYLLKSIRKEIESHRSSPFLSLPTISQMISHEMILI